MPIKFCSSKYFSLIFLTLIMVLLYPIQSNIYIVWPQAFANLNNTYEEYLNSYSIAEFGYVPYGRSLIGNVEISDPKDACGPIDIPNTIDEGDPQMDFILMAERGGCHFVQKAHYAQLAGAKMLIINDNKEDDDLGNLYMKDDGQGQEINIPVIMIYKKLGDKIKNFKKNDTVILGIHFDTPELKNNVTYEVWISSSTNKSVSFLRELKPYVDKIEENLEMTPHYGIFSTNDKNDPNCFCKGKYCAPDPDGVGPLTGQDVLQEDIRQLLLYKQYSPEKWWSYIEKLDIECLNTEEIHNCSLKLISDLGIDKKKFKKQFESTFTQGGNENKLLKVEKEAYSKRGHISFPGVIINDLVYRGNIFPASHVFEAICESYLDMPENCAEYFQQTFSTNPIKVYKRRNIRYILAVCVICMAILTFFLFCIYKRYLKKQIAQELALKANTAVSEYFAMHEAGEKDTKRLLELRGYQPQTAYGENKELL